MKLPELVLPILLLGGLLGCQAETFGAGDQERLADATVVPTVARSWPGGDVDLRSEGFSLVAEDSGLFVSEGRLAPATRLDSVTFRVRLPAQLMAGQHAFEISFAADTGRGTLETAGYSSTIFTDRSFDVQNPQPFPWDAPTGVLSAGAEGYPIYVDATTGHITPFAGAGYLPGYSAGLSFQSGIAITRGWTSGDILAERLNVYTGAVSTDSVGVSYNRQVYELSPDTYLRSASHLTSISGPRGGGELMLTESPWYFPMSPDRRFGTFVVNAVLDTLGIYGLPIIDLWTGDIARWIPGIGSTDAAAWAMDSRSLYVAARPYWAGEQRLVRLDPETGTELTSVSTQTDDDYFGEGTIWALAVDAQRDWIYDLAIVEGQWQLRVRDPVTLAILGAPMVPDQPCKSGAGFPILIPDPTGPAVQIVNPSCGRMEIYRVLLPY